MVHGDVTIAVADVDLIRLNIGLLLQAVASAERHTGQREVVSHSLAGRMGQVPHNGASPGVRHPPAVSSTPLAGDAQPPELALNAVAQGLPERINADAAGPETGLARLVLTLIEVLRKVLEHQAVRRMEGGRLSDEEVERLGLALAKLNDRMGELKRVFGLSEEDLQIDLGPLGRVR